MHWCYLRGTSLCGACTHSLHVTTLHVRSRRLHLLRPTVCARIDRRRHYGIREITVKSHPDYDAITWDERLGVHPDARGHRAIAQLVFDALSASSAHWPSSTPGRAPPQLPPTLFMNRNWEQARRYARAATRARAAPHAVIRSP